MSMIRGSEIANFLGGELQGNNISVLSASSLSSLKKNSVVFVKKFSEEHTVLLNSRDDVLAIVGNDYRGKLKNTYIVSGNPRLDFARVLARFFDKGEKKGISETAIIPPSAQIGNDVYIGCYTIIGENVVIGAGTEIRDHVVIRDNCIVGDNCIIKSNTVIGEEGFGFEFDEDGTPIRIPHVGAVRVGNNVEIGALNVIARGTLDDTIISDGVKIDDHVFIAHNVFIGENSVIIAGAEVSGSVKIGKNVWIAPQATIINQVEIGDNALVGIGAVVTKSVEPNVIVAGNPAKKIRSKK